MKVWIEFKKKITKDFHDLYLRIDVFLLANVFEEFRNMSLEYYGLDFSHYFSSPGLNWNVTLKKRGIKLGFVIDAQMCQSIKKCIRGWISDITQRHTKTNNYYVESCNKDKPSKHIIYKEANTSYG